MTDIFKETGGLYLSSVFAAQRSASGITYSRSSHRRRQGGKLSRRGNRRRFFDPNPRNFPPTRKVNVRLKYRKCWTSC
ncbi:hypothetical protein ACFSQE_13390 [Vogesella fluminis]|uniref:hypothetical protein n=1 Tax=Vogesella fluminis TaxID=1069161 RepID=UPI001673298D|nr:hypothetical protein [Vogesella fluminis]